MLDDRGKRRDEPEPERDWSSRLGANALAAAIPRFG
jgi:hypothetical protein